jgi:hypothetical protein
LIEFVDEPAQATEVVSNKFKANPMFIEKVVVCDFSRCCADALKRACLA